MKQQRGFNDCYPVQHSSATLSDTQDWWVRVSLMLLLSLLQPAGCHDVLTAERV